MAVTLIYTLLLGLLAGQAAVLPEINSRVIGGNNGDIQSVPYHVSLRYKATASAAYVQRCAGVIYSERIVLSTATCTQDLIVEQLQVVVGATQRSSSNGRVYRVGRIIVQPEFDALFMDNDLALLVLAHDLGLDKLGTGAIGIATQLPGAGSHATISGWGATAEQQASETLQLAKVELVDVSACRRAYGEARITAAMLCAGSYADGEVTDACQGDAGGALVANGVALGLVSWGSSCGRPEFPGVYTNLVHFRQWIEQQEGLYAP